MMAGVLIALELAEIYLQLSGMPPEEKKVFVPVSGDYSVCYSSDGRGLFLDLQKSEDRMKFRPLLTAENPEKYLEGLVENTPHCLLHHSDRRGAGFFPSRKREIAVLGDSFAFGEGVVDEDSLTYLLGIKNENFNFRCFAWPGQNINFMLHQTERIATDYPSVENIIYFYNLNDIIISGHLERQNSKFTDFQNQWPGTLKIKKHMDKPRFWERFALYEFAIRRIVMKEEERATISDYNAMYFNVQNEEGRTKTFQMLREMNDIAAAHSKKLTIVIYPLLYKDRFGRYPFEAVHSLILNYCKEHSLHCVDASKVFDRYFSMSRFHVNSIDFHPDGDANRLVVDYLASEHALD